ncbi:MAG: thiol:disulfide interchange protein DsbA/DsbL [Steroidobacteraceae bacterium]
MPTNNALRGAARAALAWLFLCAAPLAWSAEAPADGLQAGTDYIQTPSTLWFRSATGEVRVVEYFSWGCPHCNAFHTPLNAWVKQLAPNVKFDRVPVSFGRSQWQPLLRTYYALKNLGKLDALDDAIYDAIHRQGLDTSSIDNIARWLATQGVDARQFLAETQSPSVSDQIEAAREFTERYGVQSVPQIIINGRYVVLGQNARTYADLLAIADKLIARASKPAAVPVP